ncbi:ABC transporter ATP-binding protein [Paenalcaligenes suwonensis]|uniref:ABC transporter ATP-binding protein n=1 Tax=Paenalcaligenes suwonensis TaxID=1202713 RepID=UPI00140CBA6B|nr:ABC transporter ATP-binding protein [Paenalcaligenes suwonensis]NHC61540.1 ABC transporter ATP-binding protein [Paenalcaligenes suwonensis]
MTRQQKPALTLQHINKYFHQPDSHNTLQVLDDINLDIRPGEFISIVGSSGCGKSTLLRLILGLDTDFDGSITLDDAPIRGPGLDRGIVFQDHRLLPWLSVSKNIQFALRNSKLSAQEQQERVQQHIDLVGLQGFEHHLPSAISGGMAQRVAIARGLVNRPAILLLDEPLGALDALTRTRLQNEIQNIWQKEQITMILVTHDVDEAVFLGDRVVIMQPNPGQIQRIVDIDLERPRNRSDPRFIAYRDNILSSFLNTSSTPPSTPPAPRAPLWTTLNGLNVAW